MTGTDVLIIITFVALTLSGKIEIKTKIGWRLIVLGSFWLISQIVTDVVRHTVFADYARGWSNIGLTLVSFCVLCTLLYGRPRRFVIVGWGLVLADLISFFFLPDDLAIDYPWKFGLSGPVTLAVALLASRQGIGPRQQTMMMGTLGILNILLGARSIGGISLTVALYLGLTQFMRKKTVGKTKMKTSLKVAVAISIAIGTFGIFWVYQYAALSGILGTDARDKYEEQSSGRYGVLLGGRTELLSTIPAIIDSPILGHGSWAKDPVYLIAEQQALALLGYRGAGKLSPEDLKEGLIPAHSYLLGAWVNAGIIGAVFWGWVWLLTVKALVRIYPGAARLLPLMAYFGFSLLWDILFSPFGLDRRSQVPYCLLLIITYYEMSMRSAVQAKADSIRRMLRPALSHGE